MRSGRPSGRGKLLSVASDRMMEGRSGRDTELLLGGRLTPALSMLRAIPPQDWAGISAVAAAVHGIDTQVVYPACRTSRRRLMVDHRVRRQRAVGSQERRVAGSVRPAMRRMAAGIAQTRHVPV